MECNKKVSIVLPIYNQENNLDVSIPSVLNQSWSNLEIILVNDGSTDSSKKVIEKYAQVDERIVVICQENQGLVGATATGIESATGDYICFLDPDDYILSDFVEVFMNEIEEYDFVAMGINKKNQDVINYQYLMCDDTYNSDELAFYRERYICEEGISYFSNRFYVSRCNKLYKTQLLKNIVGEYRKCMDVSLGEDSIFTFLVLNTAKSGKTLKRINSYFYNIGSPTSMTFRSAIDTYKNKMETTYSRFCEILKLYDADTCVAEQLYFCLGNNLLYSVRDNKKQFIEMVSSLHNDSIYMRGAGYFHESLKYDGLKNWAWNHIKSSFLLAYFLLILEKVLKIYVKFREIIK